MPGRHPRGSVRKPAANECLPFTIVVLGSSTKGFLCTNWYLPPPCRAYREHVAPRSIVRVQLICLASLLPYHARQTWMLILTYNEQLLTHGPSCETLRAEIGHAWNRNPVRERTHIMSRLGLLKADKGERGVRHSPMSRTQTGGSLGGIVPVWVNACPTLSRSVYCFS
ncbi:hypothetical protein L209DRAFT_67352 [Thermothelomyces heterothallicus CBS 203.75]